MTLVTARIPELAQSLDSLSDNDKMLLWIESINITKHINLSLLKSYFTTGGGTTITPVQDGGVVILVMPDTPGGTDTVNVASLAGKSFNLKINGIPYIAQQDPTIPEAEYETLVGGGFILINGMKLYGGEKIEFQLFESISSPTSPGTASNFVIGKKVVNTNYTLDVANDLKKIIQLRAVAAQITLTIPSVDDLPDNTIIVIEASINNTKQNKVTTTGGQYIYFNNTSTNSIHISPGEVVWLYRDDDGLYVINDFGRNYETLGDPYASYKVKPKTLLCNGQEVLRADYPRLWEFVQTLGFSLVSEATWGTTEVYHKDGVFYTSAPAAPYKTVPFPYRGCFSTGNGSTTFRIPDLMNMFLRGVLSEIGSDTERHLNKPGGYQKHEVVEHEHVWKRIRTNTVGTQYEGNNMDNGSSRGLWTGDDQDTSSYGGAETRPENIGVYWLINY
jgi:hypothetical protein